MIKFANRLEVELPEDAAKKIARLAEGSMRDALTYLDQCYAMADKIITLDDVNQTLGLISDADLDEIISAVKNKNRAELSQAITHAFRSGLSSITIAESLITRLRDLEFETLSGMGNVNLGELENFVAEIRKAILEMQGSGIPDIILEMSLMKLAAPLSNSMQVAEKNFSSPQEKLSASSAAIGNSLDDGKKIFYHIASSNKVLKSFLTKALVKSFDGTTLTLTFKSKFTVELFFQSHKAACEKIASAFAGRQIKVTAVTDDKLSDSDFYGLKGEEKKFLEDAKKLFQAEKIILIESEE